MMAYMPLVMGRKTNIFFDMSFAFLCLCILIDFHVIFLCDMHPIYFLRAIQVKCKEER